MNVYFSPYPLKLRKAKGDEAERSYGGKIKFINLFRMRLAM
jgi:hypothetical protein